MAGNGFVMAPIERLNGMDHEAKGSPTKRFPLAAWVALAVVLAGAVACGFLFQGIGVPEPAAGGSAEPVRRLALVQSYWNNYQWTFEISMGVFEALGLPPEAAANEPKAVGGIGVQRMPFSRKGQAFELLVIYLDTKRRTADPWKSKAGSQAVELLQAFAPQVTILADDNAQKYVGKWIAGKIPIVFCGVNAEYTEYYRPGENVTGFHERMEYAKSLRLLSTLCPDVRGVVFLTDSTPTSRPEIRRIQEATLPLPVIEAHRCASFEDYKTQVLRAQGIRDVALAIFNLNFGDTTQEQAIAWTLAHSRLPEVTFQRNTVEGGLLCASTVSARKHGRCSAEAALRILDGRKAQDIPVSVPPGGQDSINLVRARQLGRKNLPERCPTAQRIPFATALHASSPPDPARQ